MRILLAFASLSGNTRDVARQVAARCRQAGHVVTELHVDIQTLDQVLGDARAAAGYDLHLLGSWTDNGGRSPAEMKRYLQDLVAAAGRQLDVAVFGTGETQWGLEYYCGAVRRIARFFDSRHPRLEIEQMPHGERDARAIAAWTDGVLATCRAAPFSSRNPDADHHRHLA